MDSLFERGLSRAASGFVLALVSFLCMLDSARANQLPSCAGIVADACAQAGYPNQFYDCRVERFTGTQTFGQDTLTCQFQNCYAVVRSVKSSGAELVIGTGGCEGLCEEGPGTILAQGVSPRNASDLGPGCVNDCKVTFEQDGKASCFEGVCFQVTNVTSTGETCGEDDEPAPDLPDEECENAVGGAVLCFDKDGDNCTTINGQTICTGPNEPSFCEQNPHSALCVAPSRPSGDGPDWDLTSNYNFQNSNSDDDTNTTTTINYYINITNPPPDAPPPDPDQDENQVYEGAANISGCGSFTCDPTKVEGGRIMCAQLRVQWMHMCQLHQNSATVPYSCNQPTQCKNPDKAQCAQVALLHVIACDGRQKWTDPQNCDMPATCEGGAVECAAAKELRALRCTLQDAEELEPITAGDAACMIPPQCGSGPTCQLLKQQWALECGERVAAVDNGCEIPPTCSGNSGDCLSLKLEWMQACGVGGNNGDGGDGEEPGDGEDPRDVLADAFGDGLQEVGMPDGWNPDGRGLIAREDGSGLFPALTGATGFLGAGACPVFPPVEVMGATLDFNADGAWCTVLDMLRAMVLAAAMFVSARIILTTER